MTTSNAKISPTVRRRVVEFLIHSAADLQVRPIVKYSALSLFADRFHPRLSVTTRTSNWLLKPPILECNLQLFALISLWISTKIHDSHPLSINSLKAYSDSRIKDQHFTKRDFLDAEVVFMQVLNFEIGTLNTVFIVLEDLLIKFKETARVGEFVSFDACMDVLDLLYEEDGVLLHLQHQSSRVRGGNGGSVVTVAASILVVAYVITVPKQRLEFPVVAWLKFVTSYGEEEIVGIVRDILHHLWKDKAALSSWWSAEELLNLVISSIKHGIINLGLNQIAEQDAKETFFLQYYVRHQSSKKLSLGIQYEISVIEDKVSEPRTRKATM
ncbi:hypothetical protein Ancab_007023 [Ancistrocladus abbreviatus]